MIKLIGRALISVMMGLAGLVVIGVNAPMSAVDCLRLIGGLVILFLVPSVLPRRATFIRAFKEGERP